MTKDKHCHLGNYGLTFNLEETLIHPVSNTHMLVTAAAIMRKDKKCGIFRRNSPGVSHNYVDNQDEVPPRLLIS